MSGPPPVPRQPKCARCRHHGLIVRVKGHGQSCPFLRCLCWKCQLQTQKTRVTALQKNLTRTGSPERPGASRGRPLGCCGGRDLTRTRWTDPGGIRDPTRTWWSDPGGIGDPTWTWTRRSDPGGAAVGGSGPTIPPSVLHFPLMIPDQFSPPADLLLCPPPAPGGFSDGGVCKPLMFPPVQQGPVVILPPPEDCWPVIFIAPPPQRVSVGVEVRTSSLRHPDPVLQL